MRIMSYNIHSGKNMDNELDIRSIGDVIAEIGPDVCALNEVRMRTDDVHGVEIAKVLGEQCGMQWRFGRTIYIANGEYGNGMLSRFPIVSSRVVPVPDVPQGERERRFEPRAALECIVDTGKGKMQVITCHFGLSHAEQVNAVETILSMISPDMPTVFMGDLNATPDDGVLVPLMQALRDSGTDKPLTFSARSPFEKIDYIFTSEEFAPAQLQTVKTEASDHLPVYIDTEL